jgi:hypothetical protein
MVLCPTCETECAALFAHFREHPLCMPVESDDEDMPDLLETESDEEDFAVAPPLTRARETLNEVQLREQVASDLAALRFEHGLKETAIQAVKDAVSRWLPLAQEVNESAACEEAAPARGHACCSAEARKSVNIFAGLETATKELHHMRCDIPALTTRTTKLPGGDVVSHDLGEMITRQLQHDADYRRECEAKSDEWKTGAKHHKLPTKIEDFDDGLNARWHPHLMRKATDDEANDLRIAIDVQVDDVEVRACAPLSPPQPAATMH